MGGAAGLGKNARDISLEWVGIQSCGTELGLQVDDIMHVQRWEKILPAPAA